MGVQAVLDNKIVYAGKPGWFKELNIDINKYVDKIKQLQDGKAVIVIARDGNAIGIIALSDNVKPESADAIAELHRQNLHTIMLTGDN